MYNTISGIEVYSQCRTSGPNWSVNGTDEEENRGKLNKYRNVNYSCICGILLCTRKNDSSAKHVSRVRTPHLRKLVHVTEEESETKTLEIIDSQWTVEVKK